MFYGLNCVLQKRYIEVHIPKTSECDLIWNRVFLGIIKLNEVIRVALTPILLVFIKEWEIWTQARLQRTSCEDKGRDWSGPSTSQGKAETASRRPAAGERHGTGSSQPGRIQHC